jgi:hypothetical protein
LESLQEAMFKWNSIGEYRLDFDRKKSRLFPANTEHEFLLRKLAGFFSRVMKKYEHVQVKSRATFSRLFYDEKPICIFSETT